MSTQALGVAGEAYAAKWLEQQGWTLVSRRFRNGHRDLDLVARRDGVVAFVDGSMELTQEPHLTAGGI
jgi:putative endonuclease